MSKHYGLLLNNPNCSTGILNRSSAGYLISESMSKRLSTLSGAVAPVLVGLLQSRNHYEFSKKRGRSSPKQSKLGGLVRLR
jgi:hypothetical protein